jgi:hypothetical protein
MIELAVIKFLTRTASGVHRLAFAHSMASCSVLLASSGTCLIFDNVAVYVAP